MIQIKPKAEHPARRTRNPFSLLHRVLRETLGEARAIRSAIATANPAETRVLGRGDYVSLETIETLAWLLELDLGGAAPLLQTQVSISGWRLAQVRPDKTGRRCQLTMHAERPQHTEPPKLALALDGLIQPCPAPDWRPAGRGTITANLRISQTRLTRLRIGLRRDGAFLVLAETT